MKRIYEILEECKLQENLDDVLRILKQNESPSLKEVLRCAYHPNAQWYFNEWPKEYKKPDTLPGISQTNLYTEINRIYLFQKGHPVADKMSQEKRSDLLIQILEGMEPEDGQILIDIFNGDLQIQGLDKNTVNKVFPNLLP